MQTSRVPTAPWPIIAHDTVSSLDHISTFKYISGASEAFYGSMHPHNLQFPKLDKYGKVVVVIRSEFEPVDLKGKIALEWQNVSTNEKPTARTETHLHPILRRFLEMPDPKAVCIAKSGSGYEITLHRIPALEYPEKVRFGNSPPCTLSHYGEPYFIPETQDWLAKSGFSFLQHSRISDGLVLGEDAYCGIFRLRTFLTDDSAKGENRTALLAVSPCFHRKLLQRLYDSVDLYRFNDQPDLINWLRHPAPDYGTRPSYPLKGC